MHLTQLQIRREGGREKGSSDQRTFFFLPEQIYQSRAAEKKKKNLGVMEQGKAAVAQSSTKRTRKGPEWQTGSFSALFGPKWLFCRVSAGPGSHGSVLSPRCFPAVALSCTCSHGTVPAPSCSQWQVFPMLSKHPAF